MKTNSYKKRLDHIREGLFLHIDTQETIMVYTLFGVPTLDRAISRAREAGATSVMFVPANGGAVVFTGCDQHAQLTRGIAVAYEIEEPAEADSKSPMEYCTVEQLRQIIRDNEVISDAVAGGKESVSVVRGGKVVFKAHISPEECP
jgi:hypothetical protein